MVGLQRPIAISFSLITWAAFTAFFAYYITVELPQLRIDVFKPTAVLHITCSAVLVLYALSLALRRRLPRPTPLDLPLLALVLAYAVAILTALDPRLAWETALPALFAIVLFYVALDSSPLTTERLRLTLLAGGFIAALRALLVVAQDYHEWIASVQAIQSSIPRHLLLPPGVPRVHNVGDNPNVIATVFAVLLPLTVASAFGERRLLLRFAALGTSALLVSALFFTLSRAAWLGAALGLMTAMALLVAPSLGSNTARAGPFPAQGEARKGTRWCAFLSPAMRAAVAGGLAGVTLLTLVVLWLGERRPDWLFRPSLGPRLDAMRAGLEMWWDHPLTGVGPAGYALLYPEYSGRYPLLTVHAHNGYIQAGVELGILGVLAIGAGGLVLLRRLLPSLRRGDHRQRLFVAAVAGGGVAFLVQSLLDATYEFKSVPALLAVLLVFGLKVTAQNPLDAHPVQPGTASSPPSRARHAALRRARGVVAPLVVVPLLILVPAAWLYADRVHYGYSSGLSWANAGHWAEAADRFEAASRRDPQFALYHFQAGLAQAMASDGGKEPDRLQAAISHYQRGLALEPRSVLGWANYARVLAWAGDREGARQALRQARRFGPQDVAAQLIAGTVLEELGYGEEALDAYVRTLVLDSERISAPFWEATPFRRENRRRIIEAVNQHLPLLATANPAFDLDRPEQPALDRRTRLDRRLRQAQQLLLAGVTDEAFQLIQETLAEQPDKAEAHGLLGDWYAQQGRLNAAREAWFIAGYLGDSESLRKLGETYGEAPVPLAVAGRQRRVLSSSSQLVVLDGIQFYWIGIQYYRSAYLRASPHTLLIPGEWQEVQPRAILEAARMLTTWESRPLKKSR